MTSTVDNTKADVKSTEAPQASRRRFFGKAATAAVAAPLAGFPMISVAQAPIVLKIQGSWGPNDIFSAMAIQYVDRVNAMAGGRLRLEYLSAGACLLYTSPSPRDRG